MKLMKLLFNLLLILSCLPLQGQISSYSIGDQWTYQREDFSALGPTGNIGFVNYTILDTLNEGTRTKYLVNQDTFYVENERMYFWNEHYKEYLMYYDFNATTEYQIKYYDWINDFEDVAVVTIDSISYKDFGSESLKVQHVTVVELKDGEVFGTPYVWEIYDGIGPSYFGLKFNLGCGFCDFGFDTTTDLRCFIKEEMIYNFGGIPCDTTWFGTTAVGDISEYTVNIYPNPTTGQLFIDELDIDVEYQVFSIEGKLLSKGVTEKGALQLNHPGVMLLRLRLDDTWITKRILSIK